jgi:xylulokinase
MYLLGLDIGSSSIKAALVDAATGECLAVAQSPAVELAIQAPRPGWAEQDPELWWEHACRACKMVLEQSGVDAQSIQGIGIAYQMHGLVLLDENGKVLRPSIIWCDSRAVATGDRAFQQIGAETCLSHMLNSPGNFTAAKLAWVKENEPEVYDKTRYFMLPGDYLAYRLTGDVLTTASGLSEGILWDFKHHQPAQLVLDALSLEAHLIPPIVDTCSIQGRVSPQAAQATGLHPGIPVTYRAGDQPNNALSLNVLQPGEVAATGGTSGVVYGVQDKAVYDPQSRVNSFLHVNHTQDAQRIGVLLCINGAGSQYAWIKKQIADAGISYSDMEQQAATVPVGSDGLDILPFGNGAERMLNNKDVGAHILGLQFNRHEARHLYRAALEGIAFSFVYGVHIQQQMGLQTSVLRVGNDNLFQSSIFANTIAHLLDCRIELINSTGAIGAAKAAGVASKCYASIEEAVAGVQVIKTYEPHTTKESYLAEYNRWQEKLKMAIGGPAIDV